MVWFLVQTYQNKALSGAALSPSVFTRGVGDDYAFSPVIIWLIDSAQFEGWAHICPGFFFLLFFIFLWQHCSFESNKSFFQPREFRRLTSCHASDQFLAMLFWKAWLRSTLAEWCGKCGNPLGMMNSGGTPLHMSRRTCSWDELQLFAMSRARPGVWFGCDFWDDSNATYLKGESCTLLSPTTSFLSCTLF